MSNEDNKEKPTDKKPSSDWDGAPRGERITSGDQRNKKN